MNKLDAVNHILRRCGWKPVSALDTDGASEAANVERELNSTELEVQSRGWHYNTRVNQSLAPNVSGLIQIPDGTIRIDVGGADFEIRDDTQLGSYLFDRKNNTNVFTSAVRCSYILRYGFGCIDYPIRLWIRNLAAQRYAASAYPDRAPMRLLFEEERTAREAAFRHDDDVADVNILRTLDFRMARGGREPSWLFAQDPHHIEV